MKDNEQYRGELQEAYEESLFALVMDQYAAEEGRRLMDESRSLDEAEYTLPEGADVRAHKVIDDIFKSNNRAKAAKSTLKALSRVAVILLVCGVVFATLFASVSAFRETVYKLISQGNSVNIDTSVGDSGTVYKEQATDGNRLEIRQNEYQPTWLPDGYILVSYSANDFETSVIYANAENELIIYFEYPNNQVLAVDTEDADIIENININSFDGLLCIKKEKISISWIDGERNLLARIKATNIDKDTALKIAESVKSS